MIAIDPELPKVPSEVAERYARERGVLASRVSSQLAAHPELERYLGGNPFRILEANHRNHAAFMTEVFRTNNFGMLARTLPWVYHSYHNQGIDFDYFETELALWMEVITKVLGPADAGFILPIYRWMASVHDQSIEAAAHYRSDDPSPVIPMDLHAAYEEILEHLLAGRHQAVVERARELLDQGLSYSRLLQTIFYPAMVEVGALWEGGRLSVAKEHEATAMMYGILSSLYIKQDFPDSRRGKVIIASVTNEFHELGGWMISTCLELDGWDVNYLARDCPVEELVRTTLEERPAFVGLSVTVPLNLNAARVAVAALRAALGPGSSTRIVVGGRAFMSDTAAVDSVGADLFLPDCEAIIDWARHLKVEA